MCSTSTKTPAPFIVNLRQPMPTGRKIRLALTNMGRRIVTLKPCCGHPGEPGC
jgi:hypothetical protein